jgi:hypothetical protein
MINNKRQAFSTCKAKKNYEKNILNGITSKRNTMAIKVWASFAQVVSTTVQAILNTCYFTTLQMLSELCLICRSHTCQRLLSTSSLLTTNSVLVIRIGGKNASL